MDKVTIKKLTGTELEAAKVFQWPIWEKEASRFDKLKGLYVVQNCN
jgi:hypothetical protein